MEDYMIDDRTVYHLLDQLACEVFREMNNGKTLEEIDDDSVFLRKVDRVVRAHCRTLPGGRGRRRSG
jgi:hypothetical protein